MPPEFTRRELAVSLVGVAALAQAPSPPLPANPEEELKAARDQARQNADALSKAPLPMQAEPAFVFKP